MKKVLNSLPDDEAVLFADAVHPTHAARAPPVCWAPEPGESRDRADEWGAQRINIPWRGSISRPVKPE
jgi:hypothetical protein